MDEEREATIAAAQAQARRLEQGLWGPKNGIFCNGRLIGVPEYHLDDHYRPTPADWPRQPTLDLDLTYEDLGALLAGAGPPGALSIHGDDAGRLTYTFTPAPIEQIFPATVAAIARFRAHVGMLAVPFDHVTLSIPAYTMFRREGFRALARRTTARHQRRNKARRHR